MRFYDTYFLDSKMALDVALKKNRVLAPNNQVDGMQICYYDGDKLEEAPYNCIWVPFPTIIDYFSTTINRLPQVFDSTCNSLEYRSVLDFEVEFSNNMEVVQKILQEKKEQLHSEIRNLKPDFQDDKLRFFAYGCRETVLIKYFVKNIIQAAKDIGCEVHLHTQKSDIESCSEVLYLEALKNFNPHITVNINHLNNIFLNDKVFNFVWFQDPMEILYDDTKINLRKRDFIFHLIDSLEKQLKVKNIDSKHQPFCLNDTVYKKRNDVKKEKKIVYVGGSYKTRIESHQDDIDFKIIYEEAKAIFEKKSYLKDLKHEDSEMEYLMKKYNKNLQYIGDIYAYLSRDYCVEKLCQIDTDYEIEIYGRGWENNNIVKPYFKGVVDYGEDISKIYNSATYGYCPGAYILMQRTLECAFSETIPLVLDVRADKSDGDYDKRLENGIEFFHIRDLENILRNSSPENKDFSFIKEQYNFKHFINECLNIVNSELAINRK